MVILSIFGSQRLYWRGIFAIAACGLSQVAPLLGAENLLEPQTLSLANLGEFANPPSNWQIASAVGGDPLRDKTLVPVPGVGLLINTAPQKDSNLRTTWTHGDLELDVDFLVPRGSNSSIYFQGRYAVQVSDSWGAAQPKFSDCGGVDQRWDTSRPHGQEGFEGHAPTVNVSRAPGLWQHFHIVFQAPRFDAAQHKIENAKFVSVEQNGVLVQQNIEVTGPTSNAAYADERPLGPLVFKGDGGSVAFRNIRFKRFADSHATVGDVSYKFYKESSDNFAGPESAAVSLDNTAEKLAEKISSRLHRYEKLTPDREAKVPQIDAALANTHDPFVLIFDGTLTVPNTGDYALRLSAKGDAEVDIDAAAIATIRDGGKIGRRKLTAGAHPLHLIYLFKGAANSWGSPVVSLELEGPGEKVETLTVASTGGRRRGPDPLEVEPSDRIIVQRGFVPFQPRKRLYAISVGSPTGIHYAYDFEGASLLRIWKGPFLDTSEMWHERGNYQTAKALGAATTLSGRPSLALLTDPAQTWPLDPDPASLKSQGYRLEKDGQPVFSFLYRGSPITDRIAADSAQHGLTRHFVIAKHTSYEAPLYLLLAEGSEVTAQSEGHYIIGDREYYLNISSDSGSKPEIRRSGKLAQLMVKLPEAGASIDYSLVW